MSAMAVGCSWTSLERMSSMVAASPPPPPPLFASKLHFRNGRITCTRCTNLKKDFFFFFTNYNENSPRKRWNNHKK
jgi:hypothetical protein